MRIGIGSDHAGFAYKERIKELLRSQGHEVRDFGTDSEASVDYPAFIRPVAEAVARGEVERGIVLGGSGNGEAMAANRVPGVRCALCWNAESARLGRQHNDANMISLGQRMMTIETALEIVRTWLSTPFEGGRHVRRIQLLGAVRLRLLAAAALAAALLPALAAPAPPGAAGGREPGALFQDLLSTLAPGDVQGHLALARWCAEQGLEPERREVLLMALSIDPAQGEALRGLGYVERGGIWVSLDDERYEKGWRFYKGRWLAPEEFRAARLADLAAQLAAAKGKASAEAERAFLAFADGRRDGKVLAGYLASRAGAVRIACAKALLSGGGAAGMEALAEKAVDGRDADGEAILALAGEDPPAPFLAALGLEIDRALARKVRTTPERIESVVAYLARSRAAEAGAILFRVAMLEPGREARRAACAALVVRRDGPALEGALKVLSTSRRALLRERAASLAADYGDLSSAPALVESLERTLRERARVEASGSDSPFTLPGGETAGAGKAPFALDDFLLESDSRPAVQFKEAPPEVAALRRLTGRSFGADVSAWRRWLAESTQSPER